MLPSSPRNFGWEQAGSSDYFVLSFGRYADSEARPGVSQQRQHLCSRVDAVRTQSLISTFCEQWNKHTTRWSRRERCSSASARSAHLEIRSNKCGGPSYGWIHPSNNNYFYFNGENHEESKGNAVDGGLSTRSGRSGISC